MTELLKIREVALQLKCSVQHVRNLIDSGELEAVAIGLDDKKTELRVKRDVVEDFIEKKKVV